MSISAHMAPDGPSDRFAQILEGLCRVVAVRIAKDWVADAVLLLIWGRLRRLVGRFARKAACAEPALSRVRVRSVATARVGVAAAVVRLPQGFAWLVRLVPNVAVFGSQLRHLLDDPQMVALIEAQPGLGRMLRPLCWMLAVEPMPAVLAPVRRGDAGVTATAEGGTRGGDGPVEGAGVWLNGDEGLKLGPSDGAPALAVRFAPG